MGASGKRIIGGPLPSFGAFLVALSLCGLAVRAAAAAETAANTPTPSAVSGGGVTLHSVSVEFPRPVRIFAGGAAANVINNNCLTCHSAGMVLAQPAMSKAEWKSEVEKMRDDYRAPIDPKDVDPIADYLAGLQLPRSDTAYEQNAGRQPDLQHGAVIAAQGTPSGAPACAICHAFNGVSDASGAFPRIAGQSKFYLAKQLHDFASGVRNNALMTPIAKDLSPDDIADVTAYYAGLSAPFLPLKEPTAALVERGAQLARSEFGTVAAGKDLTPCENCHGSRGPGESPQFPYLAGQYASYIALELEIWKRGYRKNSNEIMRAIAERLDDEDISALAAYFQQLPAPTQASASK